MKIAKGEYEYQYNDCAISISHVGDHPEVNSWYYNISGGRFNQIIAPGDWYSTKKYTLEAAKNFIDKAFYDSVYGWCMPS